MTKNCVGEKRRVSWRAFEWGEDLFSCKLSVQARLCIQKQVGAGDKSLVALALTEVQTGATASTKDSKEKAREWFEKKRKLYTEQKGKQILIKVSKRTARASEEALVIGCHVFSRCDNRIYKKKNHVLFVLSNHLEHIGGKNCCSLNLRIYTCTLTKLLNC